MDKEMSDREWQRVKTLMGGLIAALATGYGFASDMLGPLADLNRPLAAVAIIAWGICCLVIRRARAKNLRPEQYLLDIRRLTLALAIALGIVGPFLGWVQDANKASNIGFVSALGDDAVVVTINNTGKEGVVINQIEVRYSRPVRVSAVTYNKTARSMVNKAALLKGVVRAPSSASPPLAVDENGTMVLPNGSWESLPVKSTCDAVSSNLPCRVLKGGSIAIFIARNKDGTGSPLSPYSSYIDVFDVERGAEVVVCAKFDQTLSRCSDSIRL